MSRANASYPRSLVEPLEPRRLLTVGSGYIESIVGDGLRMPTAIAISSAVDNPPILIAEKGGAIRRFQSGTLERQPLDYLENIVTTGEMGLLGIAVDRNFSRNRNVYVSYTIRKPTDPEPHQRISRFFLGANELVSETVLLDLPSWKDSTTNIGGGLEFAFDGTLLIGVGDGGKKGQAGDLGSPFGKILRIRPDGTVPSNNPFSDGEGWQKYVWAYGLRDPAKLAVHSQNGIVYINDPGEEKFDEINLGAAGANYGWPATEGGPLFTAKPSTTGGGNVDPIFAFPHAPKDGSPLPATAVEGGHIAGGAVFLPPSLTFPVPYAGDYFFADRDQNIIRVMAIDKLTPNGQINTFATEIIAPVDLDYTTRGDLFVIAQGIGDAGGKLYRYHPTGAPAIVRQPDSVTLQAGQQTKLTVSAGGIEPLTYQWQINGLDMPGATGTSLTIGPFGEAESGTYYTVRIRNEQGEVTSLPATITVTPATTGGGGTTDPDTGGGVGGGNDGGGSGNGGSGGGGTGGSGSGGGGTGGFNPFKPGKEPKPMGPIDLLPLLGPTPFAAVGGTTSKVAVKVLNVGLDTARGALQVRLHLSPESDAAVGSSDPIIAETTKSVRIAPGKAKTVKLKVAWPEGIAGDRFVLASVDPLNTLPETNEANNVAASALPTAVSPAFVDVRTQAGAVPASIAAGGKTLSLPVSVFNDGNVKTTADVTLLIYAVPQTEIEAGASAAEAAAIGATLVQQPKTLKLAAGKGKTVKVKFAIPEGLATGQYVLVATADGAAGESDITNNASMGAGVVNVL